MASADVVGNNKLSPEVQVDLLRLLWGGDIKQDIFQRWSQGLIFSKEEPTALVQYDGGPCAVIVPVQAFVLKNLLFSLPVVPDNWRQTDGARCAHLLCSALADILCQAAGRDSQSSVVLCHMAPPESESSVPDCSLSSPPESATVAEPVVQPSSNEPSPSVSGVTGSSPMKRQHLTSDQFNSALRYTVCNGRADLMRLLEQNLALLSSENGVLLFLYSLLITKGLARIKAEICDVEEPLIDCVHGHGSQSLINLLLTGQAVPHVWDNEKNVSGLKLQGVSSRSDIGFLTLLEHLRYCEVGWYLKNPKYPIWLLGSETHLTVLFSLDRTLVGDENQQTLVRRMFSRFDEDGRGFISSDSLGDLMQLLDLVSVPEYVNIMKEKLDPEQLSIITFDTFVNEFYPGAFTSSSDDATKSFTVYHYNGLQRSSGSPVSYAEGKCSVPDMPELQMISDFSPIKTCLLTKWPTIELSWNNGSIPSMN